MNTFQTKTKTYTEDGQKYEITVRFGMHHLKGNEHPYFSITFDQYRIAKNGRKIDDSFGSSDEVIRRHFPELSDLLKWHLTAQTGEPMHYVANGLYWRDCLLGKYPRRSWDPDPIKTFAGHVCYGTLESDAEMTVEQVMRGADFKLVGPLAPEDVDRIERKHVTRWLCHRKAELREAFEADMARFDVELIGYA